MLKKLTSLLLSILMLVSVLSATSVFADDNETEILGPGLEDNTLPEIAEGCNRYFFLAPDDWRNEYTNDIGIYWWENTGACDSWPGYKAHKADAENVYYYDVPKEVWTIMWNNFLDGGNDPSADIYQKVRKTSSVCAEYYEPGESEHYPDGLPSFDGMIYVVDPEPDFSTLEPTIVGDWYYYYGNGEYGTLPKVADGCNRYFFYMPEILDNFSREVPGIYWEDNGLDCNPELGVALNSTEHKGVYYYDVPVTVEECSWTDVCFVQCDEPTADVMVWLLKITTTPRDNEGFSLGDCNGKIFVVDWLSYDVDENGTGSFFGEWFYYYGNGEYGDAPLRGDGEILTDSVLNKPGFQPIVLPYLVGDADSDGSVNVKDATAIQKQIAAISPCDTIAGDVDFAGGLTIKDATAIQKFVAGIDTGYPINTIAYK